MAGCRGAAEVQAAAAGVRTGCGQVAWEETDQVSASAVVPSAEQQSHEIPGDDAARDRGLLGRVAGRDESQEHERQDDRRPEANELDGRPQGVLEGSCWNPLPGLGSGLGPKGGRA